MDKKIGIEGVYSDVVNFAMQQNYVPIVKKLIIKNISEEEIRNINISITVEPDFAYEWTTWIETISALQSLELGSVDIKLSPNLLYSLTERMAGNIFVKVKWGESEFVSDVHKIDVLAYDEWSGTLIMPEIVCAFVTPNHPKITDVLANSNQILMQWSGNPSFTAYQSNNPNTVKMQMAAIYSALQNENITYSMPPASFEVIGQRVRLCDSILEKKMGTCLDLSLLYASCLEAAGLHPMIIFQKGHSFVGCWLEEQCFAECVQDDISMITKRIAEGINEICLVECTCYVAGKTIMFDDAVKIANNSINNSDQFEFLIDVKRTRGSGIRPIPLQKAVYSGEFADIDKDSGVVDFSTTEAPKELEVFEKIKHVEHIDITRQQIWERKLLDLSLRNTLVNFRVTKNTIQLMTSRLEELEDALADGQEFQILARPKDWENTLRDSKIYMVENQASAMESLSKTEFSYKRVRTFIDENDVAYRVTSLYRQAKVSLEENGVNTLYLALGFLKWYESDISEKERYAPLVLIPIDIVRKSAQKGYVIRIRDEEPQMNITLLEMLRQDFGLTIGGLDPLPADERGIDLKRVFNTVRQAVMDKSKWDVEELAFIGLFSFSQFIMWNDIRNRSEELKENKIVASLLSGKMEWEPTSDFPSPDTLDEDYSPVDLAVPISADSSQLSAICAAGKGNSFVLHGPPGTGKSQTITNIIANALFHGKSVLFIAEKMAALSVVQNRLESIGLAPFCLELHSNKAKKKDVLEQLEKVLELGKTKAPQEYSEKAKCLYDLRKKLNHTVEAIHKKRSFGFSLYDTIIRYEQYKDYPDNVKFTPDQIQALTPLKYSLWTDTINQLKIAANECGGVFNNPLKEFVKCNYSHNIKNEISEILNEYTTIIQSVQNSILELCPNMGIMSVKTYVQISAFIKLTELISEIDFMPVKLFEYPELTQFKERINKVCDCGLKRDDIETKLFSIFTEDILTFNHTDALKQWNMAEGRWFLPKILGQGKIIKSLKVIAKDPRNIVRGEVLSHIEQISVYHANARVLEDNNSLFSELFGLVWNNARPDWTVIEETYVKAIEGNELLSFIGKDGEERQTARQKLASEVLCDISGFKQRNSNTLKKLSMEWNRLETLEKSLSQKAKIDFTGLKDTQNWIKAMEEKLNIWYEHLEGLRNWCSYLGIKEKAEKEGLSNLIVACENGKVTTENLLPEFYRGVSMACAISVVEEDKCLAEFSGVMFENEIEKYKQVCTEFENLTKDELISRLSARIPANFTGAANSSEIGILQKAIRSGGRALSIRKLFDSIPNLLRKLCPCMLMSPISVAQYIDPQYPKFDLVIFDEASQMPTCEAVGAIARGENLIVVGDPKQLPPTSFFTTDRTDEDNYEKEDLESILDDCLVISMPQEHLLWHYRSSHESLIAFSNMQYYDNKLFTFPSPNDLVSSVKFIPVDGYYDRGKSKQNRAEAGAVIGEIVSRLKNPILCRQSIGVVTFSSAQQNLIDDLLIETFAQNPELEEISNGAHEALFIKNLENVQGDERDVILFSIGYGPDQEGRTALNFGPVNREGGWRRLNVAVSRARKEMMVFSTLRPEHIDLSKTRSQGVAGLKAFLEFAQKGKNALPVKRSSIIPESHLVEQLLVEKIKKLGYEVHSNIGCSGYKIDLGILHPHKPGEYVLGILLDGKNYRAAKTSRDRNILQMSVLKVLGWNIHRLWILDWWENQDKELEKIRVTVEEAIKKDDSEEHKTDAESMKISDKQIYAYKKEAVEGETVSQDSNLKYSVCSLDYGKGGAEEFCLSVNNMLILSQIKQVLESEAPVSRNLLCKRILSSWNISRMGARLERRFEDLFKILKVKTTMSNNTVFIWNNEQIPDNYKEFRIPVNDMTRRNMEDICPEEIANAVKYILQSQVSLLRPDLNREVYKLFGFSRAGTSMDCIAEGIGEAVKRDYVIIDEDTDRIITKE
ncbi:MAG: DUF3320 domain-containing protein [Anaerocolumna sp.]